MRVSDHLQNQLLVAEQLTGHAHVAIREWFEQRLAAVWQRDPEAGEEAEAAQQDGGGHGVEGIVLWVVGRAAGEARGAGQEGREQSACMCSLGICWAI